MPGRLIFEAAFAAVPGVAARCPDSRWGGTPVAKRNRPGFGSPDDGSRDFGELLRRLRADAGLTQEELAEAAGLSPRSVSDLERGVSRTARPQTARLLAAALGLAEPERARFLAVAVGRFQLDESPFALVSVQATATRALPRDVAGFTGRSAELDWLVTRMTSEADRRGQVVGICAIGGMAGVGKTTLAVHAAHQLAARYPDGQFFLPLHGHTPGHRPADPSDALASLLLAAGIPARQIPPGVEPRAARWRDFLAGKRVLLVLDDAAGHEQVEPLLPGTGGCTVLVTSRRRLAALTDAAVISLDVLSQDEAAEMLVRLAGRTGLKLGDPSVRELTRLCGYLPLAIGMLAGQLRHHPAWAPADVAADLAAERDRLGSIHAEDVSVAAAFSLSYQDLTSAQRRTFRRIGLQPGADIDAHAAAAVAGVTLPTARRHLEAIYDQHLLTEPSRGRYRMHDLVREHARALAAVDDVDARQAALGRLLDYYVETALFASGLIGTQILSYLGELPAGAPPACAPALTTAEEATAWLGAEDANLRAAAERAAATARTRHATLIPAAMGQFLYVQGRWQDGIALHKIAVTAARNAGDSGSQIRALGPLIHMYMMIGDYANARAYLAQQLKLARELGDKANEAEFLVVLSLAYRGLGDFALAMAACQEALVISRENDSDHGIASALNNIGAVHGAVGDFRAAVVCQRQSRDLFRAIGETLGEAETLLGLAMNESLAGDYPAATEALDEAAEIIHDLNNPYLQAFAFFATGLLQRLTGRYEAAMASYEAAVRQFDALDLVTEGAGALNELGLAQQHTGDLAAAASSHQKALSIVTRAGDTFMRAEVLNSLGELSLRLAAPRDGRRYHNEALVLARDIGAQHLEARAVEGIGRCELLAGDVADGAARLREALAIYRRIGAAAAHAVEETLAGLSHRAPAGA
jgi:tetratricopeptide (TPR) repeat protein/transcriptional regulator with XRE-family HTH domain